MRSHSPARIVVIGLSVLIFIIALAFNALAGNASKNGPFHQSIGNVSKKYETEITPAGWTFFIWGLIYFWLFAMLTYIVANLCRRYMTNSGDGWYDNLAAGVAIWVILMIVLFSNIYGWMYSQPAVLPYGFYLSWIVNMILNITWLFLWDREKMIAGLIVLALMAFSNYSLIFFCCHGLNSYGAWLSKYYRVDLWLFRVLVQNGIGVYATWTTIATLLKFTIVLEYSAGMSKESAATVSLTLLFIKVIVWFVVENLVLEKHVRYLLTIYPVVILALSGIVEKHYDAAAPSKNSIFTAILLALSCALCIVRVLLVVWKHRKQPLYQSVDTEALSPMEIYKKQKKVFT